MNKGIFLWKSANCANGALSKIVEACLALGLKWVAVKIGDSASGHSSSFADMKLAVNALRQAGLKVWGWHYVYGGVWVDKKMVSHTDGQPPEKEAEFAKRQIADLRLDGYIIDAEREYKICNPIERAQRFMKALGKPGVPVALSSYRFPSYHPEFPWHEFLRTCDVHMPQVYWGATNKMSGPVVELETSIRQLHSIRMLPVVPIGRAYIGDGYTPSADEISLFSRRTRELGCPGLSYWALDFLYTHEGGKAWADAITQAWDGTDVPVTPPVAPTLPRLVRVKTSGTNIRNAAAGGLTSDVGDLVANKMLEVVGESGEYWKVAAYVAKSVVEAIP